MEKYWRKGPSPEQQKKSPIVNAAETNPMLRHFPLYPSQQIDNILSFFSANTCTATSATAISLAGKASRRRIAGDCCYSSRLLAGPSATSSSGTKISGEVVVPFGIRWLDALFRRYYQDLKPWILRFEEWIGEKRVNLRIDEVQIMSMCFLLKLRFTSSAFSLVLFYYT